MKNKFGTLTVLFLSLAMVFTACNKLDSLPDKQDENSSEISLKSLEPEVTVKGTGYEGDYEKIVVQELVKKEECNWEIVAGIIES